MGRQRLGSNYRPLDRKPNVLTTRPPRLHIVLKAFVYRKWLIVDHCLCPFTKQRSSIKVWSIGVYKDLLTVLDKGPLCNVTANNWQRIMDCTCAV